MSELVTYEQAKKLLELGFNKPCWRTYFSLTKQLMPKSIEGSLRTNTELCKVYYSAPTVSEALDFIREEKNIACGVHPFQRHNDKGKFICWDYTYAAFRNEEDLLENNANYISLIYSTYPEAESALLTAVLEYLKKGGNNE